MEQLTDNLQNLNINQENDSSQDNIQQTHTNKKQPLIKTGVVYDKRMLDHRSEKRQHVENPSRLIEIMNHLLNNNLVPSEYSSQNIIKGESYEIHFQNQCREGTKQEILLAHNLEYYNKIKNIFPQKSKQKELYFLDTYANQHSTLVANLAVGGTIDTIEKVINDEWTNAFALVRPPGHHSGHANVPTGFCFYNNVVIGAKHAIQKLGLQKVVIVDWDIHHGDGSQKLLEDDPNILYISLHRYDKGAFYPGISGDHKNMGINQGQGMKLNFPWNLDLQNNFTATNNEYVFIFERFIIPIIQDFNPELVLVSSGFDGCINDPLGQCELTIDGYAYMTKRLMDISNNKIVVVLEGGYNLDEIPKGAEGVFRALIGENLPVQNSLNNKNMDEIIDNCIINKVGYNVYENCLQLFSEFWPILKTDQKLLDFEQKCFNNLKFQYRYENKNKIIFSEDDKFCKKILKFEDNNEEEKDQKNFNKDKGQWNFHNHTFPEILLIDQLKYFAYYRFPNLQISYEDEESKNKILCFQNEFQKNSLQSASILRITFGNKKNYKDKKMSSHWKKNKFMVKNCIIKNEYGIPTKCYFESDIKNDKKITIQNILQDFFNVSKENPVNQISEFEKFQDFVESLLLFIKDLDEIYLKKKEIGISQCEIMFLYDQETKYYTYFVSNFGQTQIQNIKEPFYDNIVEGIQKFNLTLQQMLNLSKQ